MALTLADIAYAYSAGTPMEQLALAGVSLEVDAGSLALVLGPTGSGKSTLLRAAAGLVAPDSGEVVLDGRKTSGTPSVREGGVGLVFQSPETQLFGETVADDVAFGPRNQGLSTSEARQVALDALVSVGIDPERFADRSPFALSGGEARRVAIAGVLALRPRYLLLDEPTAGLDAFGRADIERLVADLREHGTGIVIVTHDAEEFLPHADTALLLADGLPVFTGSAAGLVQHPESFERSGLRPPPVLEVLLRARRSGADVTRWTLDPREAADELVRAGGGAR